MVENNNINAVELDTLLNLNGEIFPMDNGFWTKFEVWQVEASEQIPHGIRYSFTLHDQNNIRILGYDNAHGYKPQKKRYGAKKITWDHRHKRNIIEPYEFETPGGLLEDFWNDVNKIV
jgi:hypothetical protein